MGICLDARYTYEMKADEHTLIVRKNDKYVEGFWPKGVSSLAALVGNNGAGKTTFLEAMLITLSGGKGARDFKKIVIYEDHNKQLKAYTQDDQYQILYNNESIVDERKRLNIPISTPFYYASVFRPFSDIHMPGQGLVGGAYNATDTWRFVMDIYEYAFGHTIKHDISFREHMIAHKAQDYNRIVQLLGDKKLRSCLPSDALPKYILIRPNKSGFVKEGCRVIPYTGPMPESEWEIYTKDRCLAGIIFFIFYNIETERAQQNHVVDAKGYDRWNNLYDGQTGVLSTLDVFERRYPKYRAYIADIKHVVEFLETICSYDKEADALYIEIDKNDDERKIKDLIRLFKSSDFKLAKYFDLEYTRDVYEQTQLSAGELDMLKLCSRIYDAVLLQPLKSGKVPPSLIMIDEAENSYHPAWQQQFVNILANFVSALYQRKKKKSEFQIVLTTHSPILLSDIPVMCTNYMHKAKDNSDVAMLNDRRETFGANIYNLYKDSFFLSEGLIGKFAYEKIKAIRDEIAKDRKLSEDEVRILKQRIDMIGDMAIKHYLLSSMEEKYKPQLIDYYKQKIKELEGE